MCQQKACGNYNRYAFRSYLYHIDVPRYRIPYIYFPLQFSISPTQLLSEIRLANTRPLALNYIVSSKFNIESMRSIYVDFIGLVLESLQESRSNGG